MDWLVQQVIRASDRARERAAPPRFNPRPAGVIREGSATEAVLEYLRTSKLVYHQHRQIVHGTGRSTKAVCWALIYLRELGHVVATADAERNSRYRRYAAASRIASRGQHESIG